MDRIQALDACRRDSARLAWAYRLGCSGPGTVELWREDMPQSSTSMAAKPFEASLYLDHELFGLLPLGWHAATNEQGAVLLLCEPQPGDLLIEAGNLMSAWPQARSAHQPAGSSCRRSSDRTC